MGNERMILSPGSLAGGWESLEAVPISTSSGIPAGTTACWPTALTPEYGRGSFSLYRIDGDGEGCHIRIGTKECRFMSEGCPHILHVMGWGRYMRN
ncbi:hypothetical protein [Phocaeicola vulgatus]|uniref:hypothetical protein n=1 Tax=Phocaeicola vulgatus TaxID=821 RepID=UPI0035682E6D